MNKLVSKWCDGKKLPENYIFPHGKRPGEHVVRSSKALPVINLDEPDTNVISQIMKASQEFGFFQVINHGVEERLMDDARSIFKEFFELPDEEKSRFCSEDYDQKCVLYTSTVFNYKEDVHYWRDALKHSCTPLEECMQYWPLKPLKYREVAGEYTMKVRELGSRILEMISQGLGLEKGYFGNKLSEDQTLTINQYPPCPNPSLTLGTSKHCDPSLITILLQGDVPGLQIFKDGHWIGVDPIPYAFVVILGFQMQIISNGKLRSVEHRAVTNSKEGRMSVAFFIFPTKECHVQPAKGLVNDANPPLYKPFLYQDFLNTYEQAHNEEIDHTLDVYRIKS